MNNVKSEVKKLEDKLTYETKNVWRESTKEEINISLKFCEGYKDFLDKSKTEREYVKNSIDLLTKNGFKSIDEYEKLNKGDKVFKVVKNKAIVISRIGEINPTEGVNLVGAHIDSPRLDLKPSPLYEDTELAMLKTHYYGGIKKYQWVTIPLAMHGVIVKNNGDMVEICIGEKDDDPVFTITDLLPHLGKTQMSKKMSEAIEGEALNVLIGSIPYNEADESIKEKVKLNILKILNEKYDLVEEDFLSAEIEIVPAFKAKDVGFDRSLVGGYGQDDRVCAYTAIKSIIDIENNSKTAICILSDKEEIGSMGNTGAQARYLENFIAELCMKTNLNYNNLLTAKCLENSKMLSTDVNGAVDPNYPEVNEKKNSSYLGRGITFSKYTGSRGKGGSSDANAEFIGEVRKVFNDNKIIWHFGELGKIDMGGGGTIAQYVANLGVDVIDCGVPVLSMHAPFEVTSKIDIYMTYKAYKVFLEKI